MLKAGDECGSPKQEPSLRDVRGPPYEGAGLGYVMNRDRQRRERRGRV